MSAAIDENDWTPGPYLRFRGFRLRPALDLLSAVPNLPDGPVVDLGCGTGIVGPALKARFPGRALTGVDSSPAMLERAAEQGCYDALSQEDAATWQPAERPALIFSNALLQWLPDHERLLPRLAQGLRPGGVLAIQVPDQAGEPSHRVMRDIARDMFPERFPGPVDGPRILPASAYHDSLDGAGRLTLWETTYHQRLSPAAEGHPVRAFTQSTGARPILERLTVAEREAFLAAYDAALATPYPARADGTVIFPFRRLFMVLTRVTRD